MQKTVSPDESITRFIGQKAHIRTSNQTVKHNAFMPNRAGETSVYRITGINDVEIYEIGKEFFADTTGRPLLGRADIIASEILKRQLSIESVQYPHPRHANICSWPRERSEQLLIAKELADEAELDLISSPG